jgi:hypothetical protein
MGPFETREVTMGLAPLDPSYGPEGCKVGKAKRAHV